MLCAELTVTGGCDWDRGRSLLPCDLSSGLMQALSMAVRPMWSELPSVPSAEDTLSAYLGPLCALASG